MVEEEQVVGEELMTPSCPSQPQQTARQTVDDLIAAAESQGLIEESVAMETTQEVSVDSPPEETIEEDEDEEEEAAAPDVVNEEEEVVL